MSRTSVVVIGAGHSGLAVSRLLTDARIEHVVLERGRVAERWRSERWDSLRLLTPNWLTRLPGWSYQGPDPDGYMSAVDVASYVGDYGRSFAAPVVEGTTVLAVRPGPGGWEVITDGGDWRARVVVVATGACDQPRLPAAARTLHGSFFQTTPGAYRNPSSLPDGGVLVVGASASGVQIAEELTREGRPVVLAVGSHTRVPRRYRGRDVMWWLDRMGSLARRVEDMPAGHRPRREPSLQLVGRETGENLDLATLQNRGARLTGRLVGTDGSGAAFADDLTSTMGDAESRFRRLLARIDRHAFEHGVAAEAPTPVESVVPWAPPPHHLDLRAEGIGSVVWATGCRRAYPWLQVPVLTERGDIAHERGVTAAAGLYVVGMPFQTRRSSTFLDGARFDAAAVVGHLTGRAHSDRVADAA